MSLSVRHINIDTDALHGVRLPAVSAPAVLGTTQRRLLAPFTLAHAEVVACALACDAQPSFTIHQPGETPGYDLLDPAASALTRLALVRLPALVLGLDAQATTTARALFAADASLLESIVVRRRPQPDLSVIAASVSRAIAAAVFDLIRQRQIAPALVRRWAVVQKRRLRQLLSLYSMFLADHLHSQAGPCALRCPGFDEAVFERLRTQAAMHAFVLLCDGPGGCVSIGHL